MDTVPLTTDHDQELQELQDYGATSYSQMSSKLNLHKAVSAENTKEVSRILEEDNGKEYLTQSNNLGEYPLHLACKNGNLDIVEMLLGENVVDAAEASYKRKSQLIKQNRVFGNTPLHLAALFDHVKIVKLLLKHDGENSLLEIQNKLRNTPVHLAAEKGSKNVLMVMRDKRPECIHMKGRFNGTPLHTACGYGRVEAVNALLEWGADKESRSCPVILPAFIRTTEILNEDIHTIQSQEVDKTIEELRRSEDPEKPTHSQYTPLTRACQFGHGKVVQVLFSNRAEVHPLALIKAIEGYYPECAEYLLEAASGDQRSEQKWTRLLNYGYVPDGKKHLTTPFCELIRYMPDLAKLVLHKCAKLDRHLVNSPRFKIELDFRFLGHLSERGEIEDTDYVGDSLVDRTSIFKRVGLNKSHHPLSVMVRYKQQELLDHPVVAALIHSKWRVLGVFSLISWLLYLIHLIFFTVLMFTIPHPQSEACTTIENVSLMIMDGTHKVGVILPYTLAMTLFLCGFHIIAAVGREYGTSSISLLYFLASIILLHSFIRTGLEIGQMAQSIRIAFIRRDKQEHCYIQLVYFIGNIEYFQRWMNWIELPLFILSTVFVSATFAAVRLHDNSCPYDWQWQIGVVVTLLTWIEFMVLSIQFRVIGVYVLMFIKVLKTVAELALVAFLLIVAFGLTFYFLLYNPLFMGSPYSTPGRSLLKALAMMRGDVGLDSFFGYSMGQRVSDTSHISYPALTIFIWLASLILMTTILSNMLIGLAVGDIKTIRKDACLRRLDVQIDYFLTMENQLPKKLRKLTEPAKKTFEPNNIPRREAFLNRLVQFIWGGVRYDSMRALKDLYLRDNNSVKQNTQET